MTVEEANKLMKLMQSGFPLLERPYAELGRKLGITESEVLTQVRAWKSEGLLRETSAVMEGSILGYDSALVCGKVPVERLEEVAAIISEHPTVTHNYERKHEYNLWFTIAVPHEMGLEKHLAALSNLTGISPLIPLRRTLTFKVGVVFDMLSKRNDTEQIQLKQLDELYNAGPREQRIIRTLQRDLPAVERPFRKLAEDNGFLEEDLLEFAHRNPAGSMRKYVSTLRHRKMGVRSNGMTVWNIPQEELAEKGAILAAAPDVSHCYARSTFPGFSYSLYTMLHAPTRDVLHEIAGNLGERIGVEDYLILESTREFKKTRLRYFLTELDEWQKKFGMEAA